MIQISKSKPRALSVLYVIGSLDRGGAEGHLARVVPRLSRDQWMPCIYTFIRRGILADKVEASGIKVVSPHIPAFFQGTDLISRMLRLVLATMQLTWYIAQTRPVIVHFFLPISYLVGIPATYAAQLLNVFKGWRPLRVMSRRSLNLYQRKHRIYGWLERLFHRSCDAVTGNSRAVIAELRDEGVAPDRLHLIYNGIELPRVDPATKVGRRQSLGIGEDAVVIIQVANLIPYKGHSDLLEAFAIVKNGVNQEILLCLVGRDDGIGEALAAQAVRLGIHDHILWLGARDDVAELLALSDIGVLCSHQEGFSNAVLEGMAASLSMIVTRVGGNPEAVLDGKTGCVVDPGNPKLLASAIIDLVQNSDARHRLGAAARCRLETCFSLQRCCDEYEALYWMLVCI